MITRFVCLANSHKEGGRCIAGIELDAHNKAVLKNGKPKWLRPICNTEHGEIPNYIAEDINTLDIVELEITEFFPQWHQSENVKFNEKSLKVIDIFSRNDLQSLCNNRILIFDNKGKAVSKHDIENLNHSLLLINVQQFEANQKTYDDKPDRSQVRLRFEYRGVWYDLPITDPVFLERYKNNQSILSMQNQIYLCLSLGIEWENWYYKLVASIIL